jgi:hypothetical protein
MGKAMGKAMEQEMGNGVRQGLEALVGLFTPPAAREEVLGDLHERNPTLTRFCMEALHTIPRVILSRIRRTADPQLFLMHALVLYLCYWGAAWYEDQGLPRLAIPCALVLLSMLLDDAYAKPRPRSPRQLIRGPLLGLACTFLSQAALWAGGSSLTLSLRILFYGGTVGLVLTLALRLAFSPQSTSPPGSI